jgi:hypothetical protein
MIYPVDPSFSGDRGQLADASPTATAHVENEVALSYMDVRQAPVRHFGMVGIHDPQHEAA